MSMKEYKPIASRWFNPGNFKGTIGMVLFIKVVSPMEKNICVRIGTGFGQFIDADIELIREWGDEILFLSGARVIFQAPTIHDFEEWKWFTEMYDCFLETGIE